MVVNRIDFGCISFMKGSIELMKNFQKELLSISQSIAKLAVKVEALADHIHGQSNEKDPAVIPSTSEAIEKEAT
jgi:hypothetical protein